MPRQYSRMRTLYVGLAGVVVAVLMGSGIAPDQEAPDANEQVEMFLRTFRFDEAFVERGPLRVAVLHRGDSLGAGPMVQAFQAVGAAGLRGLPVSAVKLQFESTAVFLVALERDSITAVYIDESMTPALLSVLSATRGRRVPTISGCCWMVERGVSIGAVISNDGARLVVNHRASLIEGVRLDARALRLAEVIR